MLTLTLSGNHHEPFQPLVLSSPLSPVVLGLPWLKLHNPDFDWSTSSVSSWSEHRHARCLRSAVPIGSLPEEID